MSYSAPSGAKTQSYIVTPLDLVNAIVILPFATNQVLCRIDTDGSYNGTVSIEYQLKNGTWVALSGSDGVNTTTFSNFKGDIGQTSNLTNPTQIRVKINVQATQGTCSIRIDYV